MVSFSSFPKADKAKIDDGVERGEELIQKVFGDIEKISELIGKKPKMVALYVAADWKRKLHRMAKEKPKFEELMKAAAAGKMPMREVQNAAKQLMKNVHALPEILSEKEELEALNDAKKFLEESYSCRVEVLPEEKAKHEKAKSAMPGKPAIVME
jgi:deoxyadenosine/deoxycytidine kinase